MAHASLADAEAHDPLRGLEPGQRGLAPLERPAVG